MKADSKKKCVQCGASFSTIAEYEKHLETCSADKTRKKAEVISEKLKQAYEEFE
ncbi:MAG: hypothetical protein H3Z53_02495 [archaeon]|nr:hypothetical protein [archaeon]MCP8313229.1 hypothetical protein [archaeon]MCP8317754.1 hypothetical protein [archaeon]MCP8320639.1 hypothetical protein [archaeon]